ncbi:hypothetical protein V8E54_009266 [Elaphomyces granulatus]
MFSAGRDHHPATSLLEHSNPTVKEGNINTERSNAISGISWNSPEPLVHIESCADHHPGRRISRSASDGDYRDMFGGIPAPQLTAPSRVQPPRQSTHRLQPGDVITVSTDAEQFMPSNIHTRLFVQVDEVISEDVVGGTPLNSGTLTERMVFKFFPVDSVKMRSEINAYKTLQSLQGSIVPRLIGAFVINGFRGYALGLSAVNVGNSLTALCKGVSIELFRSSLTGKVLQRIRKVNENRSLVVLDEYVIRPYIHMSYAEIVQDAQLRPYRAEQFDARAFGCKVLLASYPINETKSVSPEAVNNESTDNL